MKLADDDIIRQGYFDCRICNERHMAMVPFKVLDNDNVICAFHTATASNATLNLQNSKAKLESSIFALVRNFEIEYSLSVKNIKVQHKGIGDESTGIEIVAVI